MAANQVVLYFDRQEDAVQFTLAASSVISADEPVSSEEAVAKVAQKMSGYAHYDRSDFLKLVSKTTLSS
jgi:hypothetical protein